MLNPTILSVDDDDLDLSVMMGEDIAFPPEMLEFDLGANEVTYGTRESSTVSRTVIDDKLDRTISSVSSLTLRDCSQLSSSCETEVSTASCDERELCLEFVEGLSNEDPDPLNSHSFALERMLFDVGKIKVDTIMLNPSNILMMMALKRGWRGNVVITTSSIKEFEARVVDLNKIANHCGRSRVTVTRQIGLILSDNVYCGMRGLHILAPNGFGFEVNPYFADVSLKYLSVVRDRGGDDPGYELLYNRGGYNQSHFFSSSPWYYRYPWASYSHWLAPGQVKPKLAGSMYFCSRRVLPCNESPEHMSLNVADAVSLPYVPSYSLLKFLGEELFVSFILSSFMTLEYHARMRPKGGRWICWRRIMPDELYPPTM
jgi:hypothetical protein